MIWNNKNEQRLRIIFKLSQKFQSKTLLIIDIHT